MTELTGLEICKRIAEIEDIDFQIQNKKILPKDPANAIKDKLTDVYNPLTDKALCFYLTIKYKIELTPMKGGHFLATPIKKYDVYGAPDMYLNKGYGNKDPQRAICLAIIEANKE